MTNMRYSLLGTAVLIGLLGYASDAQAQLARAMVEKPDYEVLEKADGYEIRRYPELLVAQVRIDSDTEEAMDAGFSPLADFIFGENVDASKIDMTAPVTKEADSSSKISMTAPVTQEAGDDTQLVRFIMPKEYTLETLPKPKDDSVEILTVPARVVAVTKFSGGGKHAKMLEKQAELEEALARDAIEITDGPTFARYDPPWTLPFLRRNEVMLPIVWSEAE